MNTTRPPFTYFGGKAAIADRIAALLPDHEHYVEPFAGSLAVLLAKPPSAMETVNDISQDLMTFWRVLRDRPTDLERVCADTPHSRIEHQVAYEPATDDLERARRVWVRLTQGRSSRMGRTGWRSHRQIHSPIPGELRAFTARIRDSADRLRSVTLECRPALEVIEEYGRHRSNLIYADPPYLGELRSTGYVHELFTESEHRELLEALLSCRATVVLSGYSSPLYDDLLATWFRREIATQTGNGLGDRSRVEVIWSNRAFPQGTLFDQEAS